MGSPALLYPLDVRCNCQTYTDILGNVSQEYRDQKVDMLDVQPLDIFVTVESAKTPLRLRELRHLRHRASGQVAILNKLGEVLISLPRLRILRGYLV